MKNLNDTYLFAKVVEAGSFSAAARGLGLQTSLLSRRIAGLERELGVRLLHRSTRKLALTDVGRGFHQHALALVAEADSAWEAVEHTRSAPRGLVRISCPIQMLQQPVGAIIARFMAANPEVRVHVEATNRRVDVIEEGIDLALRVRTPPFTDSHLVVRAFGASDIIMVGAPALFAGRRHPTSLEELNDLPTLAQTRAGDNHQWEFTGPHGGRVIHRHRPRLIVDDFPLLRLAVLAGLGVACLPEMIVRADLAAGRMHAVLPDHTIAQGIAHAAFPSRRGMVPAVRALLDALAEGFRSDFDADRADS
jgi:DNA-binding transcriptional LysR family regulator